MARPRSHETHTRDLRAFQSGLLPYVAMADGPSSRRPSTGGRLWTDPREEEEQQPWLKPRRPIVPVAPLGPSQEPDPGGDPREARRRLFRSALLGAIAILAIIGVGFLADSLLSGDDTAQRAALPAVPGAAPADQRSRTVRTIYAAASPSVVSVRANGGGSTASGTGFLVDGTDSGTIVTNAHVIGTATQAKVSLDDNTRLIDAKVSGTDPSSDLAVLKVDPSAVSGRPALALAESDNVQVGDLAVAIGYPLGQPRTATAGIVSGVGRSITAPNNFQIDKIIQTDAALNPGNSGGPLLDSAGRVIGVNSQIATTGGGNVGIGFAVPSDAVREVVPRLEQGVSIRRAYLGISSRTAPTGSGALVLGVMRGKPADAAGLRVGDVITKVDGTDVTSSGDVSGTISDRRPGDRVQIEVRRGGSSQTLSATLGTQPSQGTP